MVNEEIKKQETPVDLEAQVNENEQAIANPTNNADDEPAVDSEAEVNTEAESNENQIINNQIINTMKENSNSTANGNNEQVNEQLQAQVNPEEQTEIVKTIAESLVEKMISQKIKIAFNPCFSLQQAMKAGYELVYLEGNRSLSTAHVNQLYKDIKNTKDKKFTNNIAVMSLKDVLVSHPEVKALDKKGNMIDLNTPDLERYFLILDGQHRDMACFMHRDEGIDATVEIKEPVGDPLEYVKNYNKLTKNWNMSDWKESNVKSGKTKNKLYAETDKIVELLKVSPKYAEFLLTFKKDATKKSNLVDGKDTILYVEQDGERGKSIANAIFTKFPFPKVEKKGSKDAAYNEKMSLAKSVRKVEFVEAIQETERLCPEVRATFARDFSSFLLNLSEGEMSVIKNFIQNHNFGELNSNLSKFFQAYLELHKTELEAIAAKSDATITKALEKAKAAETSKPKMIKKGAASEIIQKQQEINEYKQKKANSTTNNTK